MFKKLSYLQGGGENTGIKNKRMTESFKITFMAFPWQSGIIRKLCFFFFFSPIAWSLANLCCYFLSWSLFSSPIFKIPCGRSYLATHPWVLPRCVWEAQQKAWGGFALSLKGSSLCLIPFNCSNYPVNRCQLLLLKEMITFAAWWNRRKILFLLFKGRR